VTSQNVTDEHSYHVVESFTLEAGDYVMSSTLASTVPNQGYTARNVSAATLTYKSQIFNVDIDTLEHIGAGVRIKTITQRNNTGEILERTKYLYELDNHKSSGLLMIPINFVTDHNIRHGLDNCPIHSIVDHQFRRYDAQTDATLCYFPENYSGRLIRKSTYDANNKLVKEEINEYSIANKAKELVNIKVIDNYVGPVNHCLSIEAHPYYNPYIYNGRFFITLYPYIAYDIQLTQQTETEYFNSVPISKEKLYTYNQRNQISTCQTSTSRSDYIQETYKYAADSSFYKDHLDYNVLTTIMRYKRTSGSSTAILENKYGNAFTKFTLLSSTESSNISPKRRTVSYKYDSKWNPVEVTYQDSSSVVYLWGYKYSRIIAKITNITYAKVLSRLGESSLNTLCSSNIPNSTSLYNLQNIFSDCEVTTWLYNPSYGVSEVRSPNGLKTFYEYDAIGRVSEILDLNRKTIMSFQYQLSHNGTSQNFFKTRTMMNEEGNKYMEVYSYYDGLGRPYQTVECKITPFQTHLITLQEYDAANRKTYTWLPVESATSTYMPSASVKAQAVADYGDTHPYTKTEYEASPLNKIVNQYGAGEDWNNHPVHIEYMTNTTSSPLNCLNYMVNDNGALVSSNQYYAAGQLYVTKSTDEDNNVGYTFTDKSGHTILTRQISGSQNLDTYYVYDGLDNLRYVLQPMYQTNANLNMYAFQYKYMGRQLCIEKKMPGAEAIKYVYDKLDRLIFSQDGNQRLQNEWTFYLYDRLNRLTIQGICMEIDRLNLIPDVVVTCYRENSNTGLGGSGYYSTFIPIDKVKEIHIVNYYDDYKFCSLTGFSGVPHFSMGSNAKGYLTGNVVTILEDGKKLYSANYYDVKGRMTKKVSSNHMNEYEVDNITYSFTDKPLTASHTHTAINATELYTYVYDHAERLQEVRHKLNENSEVKLAINTYDKLGRLKTKTHHGTSGHKLTYEYNIRNWLTQINGRLFEQNLYYNTGSGSQCYNGNIGSMTWKSGEDGIRGYKFTYDNMSRMRNAIYGEGTSITPPTGKNFSENVIGYDYNGNITGLQRYGKVSGSTYGKIDDLSITYVGNQLNNVTDAATDPLYNGAFNFVDGNKTSIQEYKYDSNGNLEQDYNKKIAKIQYNSLNLPSALQFANGNSTDYLYGADGMKRRVTHKTAIANISVPMGQIKELASSQISQTNTTDYCNNVIYENGVLSMILTEEGYVTLSGDAPIYHYYLKDHQGNNRVVINQASTVEQINHYYPFGGLFEVNTTTSGIQSYKYNGKELDRIHGVDWYDYEARMYDGALGRFTTVDPLTEKYYSTNLYAYCKNNPINRIDPDGKDDYLLEPRGRLHNCTPYAQRGKSGVDKLHSYSGNSKSPMGKSITVKSGLLSQMLEVQKKEEGYSTYGSTRNIEDAAEVFKFAADNSKAEWKFDVYNDDGAFTAVVATDQKENNVQNGDYAQKELSVNGTKVVNIHSHPDPNGTKGGSDKDMENAKRSSARNGVYFKANQTLYEYNGTQSNIREIPIQSAVDLLRQLGIY
jgi:RHS repeat-associated protein